MANLVLKPSTGAGNSVIIKDQGGGAVLTTADSGAEINNVTSITASGNLTIVGDLVPATPMSHRNVWINGAMQISQRYGTSVHTPTHPNYGLDRYKIHYSGGPVYSSQQVTDVPAGKGFTHSAKYTVTTADATATSTDQAYVKTSIEGYDWARFCYGTASAKTTTLSFYVKSSVAGVYSMAYKNASVNRSYSQVYTISSANTWERISITIPGDTSGTWATDNTIGCSISFDLGSGTGRYQTAGSWGTGNIDGATSAGADTWINTNGATFYITGIQLEEGSSATPFEHRSYGDELIRCQRYLISSFADGVTPGGTSPASLKHHYVSVYPYNSGNFAGIITEFPVRLRSGSPTITFWTGNASTDATSGRVAYFDGSWSNNNGLSVDTGQSGAENFNLGGTINSSTRLIQFNYLADAEL